MGAQATASGHGTWATAGQWQGWIKTLHEPEPTRVAEATLPLADAADVKRLRPSADSSRHRDLRGRPHDGSVNRCRRMYIRGPAAYLIGHVELRHASGGRDRRCPARAGPTARHARGPADLGAVRPAGDQAGGGARADRAATPGPVAVAGAAAGDRPGPRRHARRGADAAAAGTAARGVAGAVGPVGEGRLAAAHRLVQGPRAGGGDHHGPRAGRDAGGHPHGRQRRRGDGGLRGSGGHGGVRLHAGRHADDQSVRGGAVRCQGVPGRRADHRLRADRAGGAGADGLVRPVDAARAVPAGGEEDDGAGAGAAVQLAAARRDPLPHRRRYGADRHVEGFRRAGRAGLAGVGQAAADGGRAERRVRPDRPRVRGRRAVRQAVRARRHRRQRHPRAGSRR
jgi:hypothetical protein